MVYMHIVNSLCVKWYQEKTAAAPRVTGLSFCLVLLVEMYMCYLCGDNVKLQTVEKLRFHLLRHKDNCELLCPIRCRQGQCMSTYTNVFNLIRHIKSQHAETTVAAEVEDSASCRPNSFCADRFVG